MLKNVAAPIELVESARRGDKGAMLPLLSLCQPYLKRFARRSCSSSEDTEDAVPLALWQLYRRVGARQRWPAGWQFRIVERECYRLLRLRKGSDSLDELPEALEPQAAVLPPDLRRDLAQAIEPLSPPYCEVPLLRHVREQLLASGCWLKDGAPQTGDAGDTS